MKNIILIIFLVVLVTLGIWVCRRFRLSFYGMIGIFVVCMCLWLVIGSVISVNILPKGLKNKIDKVQEVCGDTYVRSDGSTVYLLINNKWVDINDIQLVGDFMEDLYIEYGGEKIYVGHSGLYNTLKVLESVGLISCE